MLSASPQKIIKDLSNHFVIPNSSSGICAGYARMAIFAALAKDLVTFENRLKKMDWIYQQSPEKKHQLLSNYNQEKNFFITTENDEKIDLKDIEIFLSILNIIHNPENFPNLFQDKNINQYSVLQASTLSLLLPVTLDAVPPVIQSWTGCYTDEELTEIIDLIQKNTLGSLTTLELGNGTHAISVIYNRELAMGLLVDANKLSLIKHESASSLSKNIFHSLRGNTNELLALKTISFFVPGSFDPTQLDSANADKWREVHRVTDSKAKNRNPRNSHTWLHHAASLNLFDLLKELVQAGADVNVANKRGTTPLQLAYRSENMEMALYLINNGIHVECSTLPLSLASQNGHFEGLQALIKAGADLNQKPTLFPNLLQSAILGNHIQVVNELIKNPSSLNQEDDFKDKMLELAIENGSLENVKKLIEYTKGFSTQAHFSLACKKGHLEIAKYFLEITKDKINKHLQNSNQRNIKRTKKHIEINISSWITVIEKGLSCFKEKADFESILSIFNQMQNNSKKTTPSDNKAYNTITLFKDQDHLSTRQNVDNGWEV